MGNRCCGRSRAPWRRRQWRRREWPAGRSTRRRAPWELQICRCRLGAVAAQPTAAAGVLMQVHRRRQEPRFLSLRLLEEFVQLQRDRSARIDQRAIDTIRTLAMDAVEQAKSGHPGTPMALAPLVYTLWLRVLRFDPEDPLWPNRDRFVLSNGHASMLLYAVLYLG